MTTARRGTVIGLMALVFASPADAAPKRNCGPRSAPTVTQSSTIRVYGKNQDFAACWRRSRGKAVDLRHGALGPLRLRGRYVAYVVKTCEYECGVVVDIVDVKRRESVESTAVLQGTVRTLVATRGGAAAFLVADGGARYVGRLDSLGGEVIDRGREVRSLTLHAWRLHWLNGTTAHNDHIAHTRRCGPITDTHTVALNRTVRAYYTPRFSEEEYRNYACLLGGGKPFLLEYENAYPSTSTSTPVDFQVAGHHVFWLELGCLQADCSMTLHTADVANRTQRQGQIHPGQGITAYPNGRGFAALFDPPSPGVDDNAYLYGFDSAGERLLDKGPGIDPASIVVYADAVIWRKDGEQRSAPLR